MTEGILRRSNALTETAPVAIPQTSSYKSVYRALERDHASAYRRACLRAAARSLSKPFKALWLWLFMFFMPLRQAWDTTSTAFAAILTHGGRVLSRNAALAASGVSGLTREAALYRRRHPIRRITMVILLGITVTFVFCAAFFSVGLEVFLSGQSIGYVGSQNEFDAAVSSVSAHVSDILQQPYRLKPDVTYQFSLVTKRQIFNREQVEQQLFRQISEVKTLQVLTVDGEVVGAVASQPALQTILDDLLDEYPRVSVADRVSFVKDVQIQRQLVAATMERTPEEMRRLLASTVREEISYTVREGDTWESIAGKYGMTAEALQEQNKATAAQLIPSGKLLISPAQPYLSVASVKRIYYTEPAAFPVETVENPDVYQGESEILVTGVDGEVQIMADVSYVDGREVSRAEAGRVMLKEPVTQVVSVGTKEIPPKYPTGTFIKPYNGIMTSGFGNRNLFGKWSTHEGIDYAGNIGAPIAAADGGWVIFSGVKNGYGNCVIIKHLNGLTTLYGHCSKLLVTEGQAVAQGEKIALVGNTGRSTGAHLHFEIRVNDVPKNPMNYLNN